MPDVGLVQVSAWTTSLIDCTLERAVKQGWCTEGNAIGVMQSILDICEKQQMLADGQLTSFVGFESPFGKLTAFLALPVKSESWGGHGSGDAMMLEGLACTLEGILSPWHAHSYKRPALMYTEAKRSPCTTVQNFLHTLGWFFEIDGRDGVFANDLHHSQAHSIRFKYEPAPPEWLKASNRIQEALNQERGLGLSDLAQKIHSSIDQQTELQVCADLVSAVKSLLRMIQSKNAADQLRKALNGLDTDPSAASFFQTFEGNFDIEL